MKNFFKNKKVYPQYLKHSFCRRGMSILEILIIIGILSVIFLITIPQFSKMRENQVLKNAIADITSSVNNARSQSLASQDSSEYGIHFQADKIIIFKGKVFSLEALDNKVIDIVSPASITNVLLAGVSSTQGNFYFERLSAIPSKTGTITVTSPSITKIITISATGLVNVN